MKTIALAGNPNSGKSTLFNALTGSTQFVGNWPGVTVEKKEGKTKINNEHVKVVDLPGIYSLSPYSNEEIISRDFILDEHPDVVIDIVDASNLERNLYLTTQLIEIGVRVVVALNMMDVVEKKGEKLSSKTLSKELGCPVCEISAISKKGINELKEAVWEELSTDKKPSLKHGFKHSEEIEKAVSEIEEIYAKQAPQSENTRFVALKLLSGDKNIIAKRKVNDESVKKAQQVRNALEEKLEDDIDSVIAESRYSWISSVIDSVIVKKRKNKISLSDKIDKVLTNKWLGFPIFFLIIYGIYFICLNPNGLGKKLVGLTFGVVIKCMVAASTFLSGHGVSPWLTSLVSDGVIFGVGIVVAFIPYLMILFVFLAILEECGYMARVTFIMDRLFRRFGLSGKSFIPMLLGTGCTVQAVASTRTIEDENDRKMTIFLTPFMPCATKMPTILLVVSLFGGAAYIAPLCYLVAIVFIILGGIFLKHTFLKGKPAPFVMELPEYKLPRIKNICHFVWEKTVSFFKKASTIILITTVIIWFLKYFTPHFEVAESIDKSILASIGRALAPIFAPLGFGDWRIVSALITGYVAKDNVIATFGLIFGEDLIAQGLAPIFNPANAISFILFFILSSPCFAAMGAMRKELGSRKLAGGAIAFQITTAYISAMLAYWIAFGVMTLIGA